MGTLVALADGGALLVGRTDALDSEGISGEIVRSLRYEPRSGHWTEVDRSVLIEESAATPPSGEIIKGHVSPYAAAVSLADGRVLVAGGGLTSGYTTAVVGTDRAALYDPAGGAWTDLQPMPEARAGGTAVALPDGSALVVGGFYEAPSGCSDGSTGLVNSFRFVPGP
jgi:hypothetical protein